MEHELIARTEPAVLDHAPVLGLASGQPQPVFLAISNEDQPHQPLIRLCAGPHVR